MILSNAVVMWTVGVLLALWSFVAFVLPPILRWIERKMLAAMTPEERVAHAARKIARKLEGRGE